MGVYLDHLEALGNYAVDKKPTNIIHLGDHFDMPSLSDYESPTRKAELKSSAEDDYEAGIYAMELFFEPINKYNRLRKRRGLKAWKPKLTFCLGNHEYRIQRYTDIHTHQRRTHNYDRLELKGFGWDVQPFLKPVEIHGIQYAHYFYNPNTGRAIGGTCLNKLNKLKFSFTMGHQQGKDIAEQYLNNSKTLRGLVVGSFYQHEEEYKGYQANDHWRGAVYKHEVKDGDYDLMELSLNYLLRRWV
jgi:hypothetical protein